MAGHLRSGSFVASARTATREMPVATPNTPPFVAGTTLLVHNGSITRFHDGAMDLFRRELRPETRGRILGNGDTEHVAALLADADPARDLAVRLRSTVERAARYTRDAGTKAQLTLIAADASVLVALRAGVDADPPSLVWRTDARGTFLASEPLDEEPGWTAIDVGTMLIVRAGAGVLTEPV